MAAHVVTPEDVLESLMNDGTMDAIRLKIMSQIRANVELKNHTMSMVEHSKVLNTPGAEKQTKRELFDALRKELEVKALEKASRAVWEVMLDRDGLGKEISDTVLRAYCQLSGQAPPQSGEVFGPEEMASIYCQLSRLDALPQTTSVVGPEEGNGMKVKIDENMKLEEAPPQTAIVVVGSEEEKDKKVKIEASVKLEEADASHKPSAESRSFGESSDGVKAATNCSIVKLEPVAPVDSLPSGSNLN